MILINVSFTREFFKVTTSLVVRILNPKADAFLTSFLFILGTLVGVMCPVDFFLMAHNEIIDGLIDGLKNIFCTRKNLCCGALVQAYISP